MEKDAAEVVLGYLNFSSGAFDPAAWRAMNAVFAGCEADVADGLVVERDDTASRVAAVLRSRLAVLEPAEPAFRDASQVRAVIDIVFDRLLPGYRRFHGDLLAHQPPGGLERPFFVMAAARAVLALGGPWDDPDAVASQAIDL